jgi:hypothetical protein
MQAAVQNALSQLASTSSGMPVDFYAGCGTNTMSSTGKIGRSHGLSPEARQVHEARNYARAKKAAVFEMPKKMVGKIDEMFDKEMVQTIAGTKGGAQRLECHRPIDTLSAKGSAQGMTRQQWKNTLAGLKCPADFCKFAHVEPSESSLVKRATTGYRWDGNGDHAFFGMALFPTILTDDKTETTILRPYAVCYSSDKPTDRSILHVADWQFLKDSSVKIYVDHSAIGDDDTYKAVVSAIHLCQPHEGAYMWVMPADQESSKQGLDALARRALSDSAVQQTWDQIGSFYILGGASLGLACIAALLHFPPICFTGFVRKFHPDMMFTFDDKKKGLPLNSLDLHHKMIEVARGSDIVEEVDLTNLKVTWALAWGFPLCIPYSDPMGRPLATVLDPANPIWSQAQRNELRVMPNAYTMVLAEEGIPYSSIRTPILIAITAEEACVLAEIALASTHNTSGDGNSHVSTSTVRHGGNMHARWRKTKPSTRGEEDKKGSKRSRKETE